MLVKDTVCIVFLIFHIPVQEFMISVSNSSLNNSLISYSDSSN